MPATASYGALLKRYTPESLIENEFSKLSYIWANCEKDKSWRGGAYEVPLLEAGFNSIQFGSLAASNDIGEMDVALGTQSMKELWGSILVRESDLYRHGDMEQSYLKIMPDRIEEFVKFMQEQVSSGFLQGTRIALATANGTAGGAITVDKPYMFRKGMKVEIDDADSAPVAGYVRSININTGVLSIFDARTGGAAVDLSGYTTAQAALVRIVGSASETFTSLPNYLLTATEDAASGSNTAYGLTKSSYTTLQALSASGSAYTASTVLDDILGTFYSFNEKRGNIFKEVWVSYGIFKNISRLLESYKRATIVDKKAGYGFQSVDVVGAEGMAKIVALREMPSDKIYFGEARKVKFAGADPFKRKMYNGEEFFMVRGTDGPQYISDMALRGDFIIKPNEWGVVHSIPSGVSA
jgi:hypothetical protein